MIFSAYNLLVVAYIVVWLAIFLYVARLHREQRRLSREMQKLQSQSPGERVATPRTEPSLPEFQSLSHKYRP